MEWTLPGTVIRSRREEADQMEDRFRAMFMAGGMVLSQVTEISGLEAHTIQNWVKRGFLPPPRARRYSLNQLCRILNIQMLRSSLSLETVCRLLGYINGKLNDEEDDIIDDASLYFLFVRLAARAKQLDDPAAWDLALADALADYREPVPGAKERIEKALRIMLVSWIASMALEKARQLLQEL